MRVDEVIKSAIDRAGVIRVRNAMNPLLWLSPISATICWIAAFIFRDDQVLKYAFVVLGACLSSLPLSPTSFIFSWIGTAFSPKNS
jgi:hypothetical protein